jgi:nucleotide-binding universal stress UspA family protein
MTTKPVIAGTDGSAEALRAVEWAAKEAERRGAPLRIVSAAELLPRVTGPVGFSDVSGVADVITRGTQGSLDAAAKWAAEIVPGVAIDTGLLTGPAAVAVTDCGEDAQLLVVGFRGNGPFTAMVLGSVSRYAAIHAACPVVVVREETLAAHRQIVVGIRDARDCDAALTFAFEEAGMRKASLLAVHAWESLHAFIDPGPDDAPVPPSHTTEANATVALTELLSAWRAKYPDVIVDQDVVHGHPGRVLAGYSARADLVVLGRHGEHGVARVAHAVLSHAHGPVATIPSA